MGRTTLSPDQRVRPAYEMATLIKTPRKSSIVIARPITGGPVGASRSAGACAPALTKRATDNSMKITHRMTVCSSLETIVVGPSRTHFLLTRHVDEVCFMPIYSL